jgi:hypothetical protein
MSTFQGEIIRYAEGREVVRFTTASGVRAVIDTSISDHALWSFAQSLRRKIARSAQRTSRKSRQSRDR